MTAESTRLTTLPAGSGEWVQSVASIEPRPPGTGPGYIEPVIIEPTSVGYLLAGHTGPDFAVWRSTDLAEFELIYLDACCERRILAWSIAEFGDTLLISGSGEEGLNGTQRAFVLQSDDGGESWTSIEDPLFAVDANRVDEMMMVADTVIAYTVDDRNAEFRTSAAWTDDLGTWHPIELPNQLSNDTPWFVTDGSIVFAVASRFDGLSDEATWAYWSSTDGGRTFRTEESRSDSEDVGVGGYAVVDGQLVLTPRTYQDGHHHSDPGGVFILRPGTSWEQLEPETGTWGDGDGQLIGLAADESSGRMYTLAHRVYRASEHYCFDDASTCRESQLVMLATDDGRDWLDVTGVPDLEPRADHILTAADGSVAILSLPRETPGVVNVTRWVGNGGPDLIKRDDYGPPHIPVPLYAHPNELSVGEIRRYLLAVGGCGSGMYIEDQRWEPDVTIGERPPEHWPFRASTWEDGAAGHVYGQVERITEEEIEFSIDGLGPVASFRPAPPLDYSC